MKTITLFQTTRIIVFIIFLLGFLIHSAPAAEMVENSEHFEAKIAAHLKHADTYFWFGIAEKGNLEAFRTALWHVTQAAELIQDASLPPEALSRFHQQIDGFRQDIEEMAQIHIDTLYGVFPLVRFINRSLFLDPSATGNYELVDDPDVVAVTSAAAQLQAQLLDRWGGRPQLHVVINSMPQNSALENEVLFIFQNSAKFFTYNAGEIAGVLNKDQLALLKNNQATSDVFSSLCKAWNLNLIALVTLVESDIVEKEYFYTLEARIYNQDSKGPVEFLSTMGFSRDRNVQQFPVIVANFVLLFITLFRFFAVPDNHRIFNFRNKDDLLRALLIATTAFFIGRIFPWAAVPILSTLMPAPDTLVKLSFWWPLLLGLVIFTAPAMLYRMGASRLGLSKGIEGNNTSVFTGVALGGVAYLCTPLFLLLENRAYSFLLPMSAGAVICAFFLGRAFDRGHLKSGWFPVSLAMSSAIFYQLARVDLTALWINVGVACVLFTILFFWEREIHKGSEKSSLKISSEIPKDLAALKKCADCPSYIEFEDFPKTLSFVEPLLEGKNCQLAIVGPEGVGKTATAQHLIRILIEQSEKGRETPAVMVGRCRKPLSEGTLDTVPYGPFQEALSQHLQFDRFLPKESQLRQIDETLSGVVETLFPIIGIILPSADADQQPAASTGEIHAAVEGTLRKIADTRPVILFIDDIQWIDTGSADLLAYLATAFPNGELGKILILMTSQTKEALPSAVEESIIDMVLPSSVNRTRILLDSLGLKPQIAKVIVENSQDGLRTGGGLFWILRVVADFAEKGLFHYTKEGFDWVPSGTPPNPLPIPSSFMASIKDELKAVGPNLPILECAACIGMRFGAQLLEKVLNKPRLEVLQALRTIESATGLIYDDTDNDDIYAFSNTFVLETLRDQFRIFGKGPKDNTVPQIIREYHLGIAKNLEAANRIVTDESYAIASHYYAAGKRCAQKGLEWCLRASKHATKVTFSFDRAKKYIDMAAECAMVLGREFDAETKKLLVDCECHHISGTGAMTAAEACLAYINHRQEKDDPVPTEVLIKTARALYEAAGQALPNRSLADSLFRQARKLGQDIIQSSSSPVEKAEGLHFTALSLDPESAGQERIDLLKKALKGLNQTDSADIQAQIVKGQILNSLAYAYERLKNVADAKAHYLKSIEIKNRKETFDKKGLAISYGGLGRIHLLPDHLDTSEARKWFEMDLKISQEINDIGGQTLMHSFLGQCALLEAKTSDDSLEQDRANQAVDHYMKSLHLANQPGGVGFALKGIFDAMAFLDTETANRIGAATLASLSEKAEAASLFPVWISSLDRLSKKDFGQWVEQLRHMAVKPSEKNP